MKSISSRSNGPVGLAGLFHLVYRDAAGRVGWTTAFCNGVTYQGANHFAEAVFRGGPRNATWLVRLIDQSGFAGLDPLDTLAAPLGWQEYGGYAGGVAWSPGPVAGGLVSSVSPTILSITAPGQVRGAYLAAGTVLYATGAASSPLAVAAGGTISINYSVRQAPR